jgi:DNA-binding response OmpR family regulator
MSRILIVEDDSGIAFTLSADLAAEGYQVTIAGSGADALTVARGQGFDLVLLDIMLPGKDGFDVCRELRRSGATMPIIMVTAKTQEAEKILGARIGGRRLHHEAVQPARAPGARESRVAARRARHVGNLHDG